MGDSGLDQRTKLADSELVAWPLMQVSPAITQLPQGKLPSQPIFKRRHFVQAAPGDLRFFPDLFSFLKSFFKVPGWCRSVLRTSSCVNLTNGVAEPKLSIIAGLTGFSPRSRYPAP
eukprot:778972-Rhodomonas_salina.1